MPKSVEYNRSENAQRKYKTGRQESRMGRSRVEIECPFCHTTFWAYIWSISGGGKKCENRKCGAKHTSFGVAYPVAGRENL